MARGAAHYQTLTARDLSRRQKEVLDLVAAGRTNGEIAERLGISLDGAKWHVSEILGKLGVASREEAAEWWRVQRGVGSRLASFTRVFAPLASWRFGAPVLAAVGITGAIALGILLFRDTDDDLVPARCTVDDVILEPVEAYGPTGPGQGVFIALTARSRGTDCAFKGVATAWWDAGNAVIATPDFAASIDTTLDRERTPLAYVTLSNWCSSHLRLAFSGGLKHEGDSAPFVTAGPQYVVERPPCDPGPGVANFAWNIMPAVLSSFMPDLGPDPFEAIWCYAVSNDPKWFVPCETVDKLQGALNSNNLGQVFALAETQPYTCPAPGTQGLGGPWPLCEGAAEGDVRHGMPVAMHGSHGGMHSVEQLEGRLHEVIEASNTGQLYAARFATVACVESSSGCEEFVLGIAVDAMPSAAYLKFRRDGGGVKLTGAGFAGDIALIIRRGGEISISGNPGTPERFIPIVPPY